MKLKKIASLLSRNKCLIIFTSDEGEQWLSDGAAMYSISGMPHMTPDIVLRIFDVPPDKQAKWHTRESEMPTAIDFADTIDDEQIIEPLSISVEYRGESFLLFPDGRNIYSFNREYLKPLLDNPDYLSFYKRKTENGGFVLALKVGLELKAVIMPKTLHETEEYTKTIKQIADLYKSMSRDRVVNAASEIFSAVQDVIRNMNPETGEVIDEESQE
jgi:hypothetical protein